MGRLLLHEPAVGPRPAPALIELLSGFTTRAGDIRRSKVYSNFPSGWTSDASGKGGVIVGLVEPM